MWSDKNSPSGNGRGYLAPGAGRGRNQALLYFALLILAYLLFIGLASFYLADAVTARRAARAGADELFFLAGEFRLRWWNLRDISTNILLYMPLGFLVALFLGERQRLRRAGIYLWLGLLLSIGVEMVQAFIGRFSDATDVISNCGGYILGFVIARSAILRFGMQPASLLGLNSVGGDDRLNHLAGLRFMYVAVVVVTSLLPLDISVSLGQVFSKLQAGDGAMPGLIVDPFYHFRDPVPIQYLTLRILPFLPLAFLSSYIQLRRGRSGLMIPASHCLLLAVLVEFANLFIRSGRSDVLVPVLGFTAGLAVAWVVSRYASLAEKQDTREIGSRSYLLFSMLLLYCMVLVSVSLSPYEFELSIRAVRDKFLSDSNLLPFRLHFSARSVSSAIDIVREFILYAPLGACLATWLPTTVLRLQRRSLLLVAGVAGLLFGAWMELLQLTVVGRYVDITDILLAACGSLAGALLAPVFAAEQGRPRQP